MSVAALSTNPAILGTTPAKPIAATGPKAVNDAQPFAKLIEQPDGDAPSRGKDAKASPDGLADQDIATDVTSEDQTAADSDTKADGLADGDSSLLTDIEAMLAAASRMIVTALPTAPTPAAPQEMPAAPTSDIAAVASMAIAATLVAAPTIPTSPKAQSTAPQDAAGTTSPETATATMQTAFAGATAKPPVGGKDIASLIATLKSAVDVQGTAPVTPIAQPVAPSDPNVSKAQAGELIAIAKPDIEPAIVTQPADTARANTAQIATAAPSTPAAIIADTGKVADVAVTAAAQDIVPVVSTPAAPTVAEIDTPAAAAVIATVEIAAPATASPAPVAVTIDTVVQATPYAATAPVNPRAAAAIRNGHSPVRDAASAIPPEARPDARRTDSDAGMPSAPIDPVAVAPTQTASADTGRAEASAPTATATLADQTVDRQLDLARETQWLDRLARDIGQAATQQGNLKFQLNPEHLGSLQVEITNSAAGASIRMTTDREQARDIIADAQPRLLAEVRAQGLRVAESHVDLNNQQQPSSGGHSQTASGQASAGQQQQQRRSSEDHKPFSLTSTNQRDVPGDSATRDDGELYA